MIYLAKRCETLEEFKRHKFSTLLALGKYEQYDDSECIEIENGFYGIQTLTDFNGRVYENWRTHILKNLDNGTQIQIDIDDDERSPIKYHFEIFNVQGKLTHSIKINDTFFSETPTHRIMFRPSGIGEGTYYSMDEDFKITKSGTHSGMDVLDYDPDFLNKMDDLREATYMPFMRGGREKYLEK